MSKGDRKAAQRKRDKELGVVRLELRVEADEAAQLDELCRLLRPGKEPYTRPELFGLLIRRARIHYDEYIESAPRCEKCGEAAPVAECCLEKESNCWRFNAPRDLAVKVK